MRKVLFGLLCTTYIFSASIETIYVPKNTPTVIGEEGDNIFIQYTGKRTVWVTLGDCVMDTKKAIKLLEINNPMGLLAGQVCAFSTSDIYLKVQKD